VVFGRGMKMEGRGWSNWRDEMRKLTKKGETIYYI